jgi:hypothetical protein
MSLYFFSKSWTYERGVSATSSGGSDVSGHLPAEAFDYDKLSYWENDGATPSLVIDLGTAQTIDSLFLKEAMITTFKLYYSHNGSDWTEVTDGTKTEKEAGIWWWTGFTEVTKRYWKVEVTAKGASNVKVYEVMLMELRLTLSDDLDLPSMVVITPKDTIGGLYPLVDGSNTSYAGTKDYAEISIEFKNVDSDVYDYLYGLYTTPSLRYPLVIIPDDDKPSYIYRVIWAETPFDFQYNNSLKLSGFDGTMKLMEY